MRQHREAEAIPVAPASLRLSEGIRQNRLHGFCFSEV